MPFQWATSLQIDADTPDAWGSYTLDGDLYRLDSAVEGLGGAAPLDFGIDETRITRHGRQFQVAGHVTNLFAYAPNPAVGNLIWDARGFGLAAEPDRGGLREAALFGPRGRQRSGCER
ncbi:MAG: hypothetical protein MO852_06185 [Candidatus Devosia euplotis]|nr:hypothetical protein [Candidatus Devosia euplotis]